MEIIIILLIGILAGPYIWAGGLSSEQKKMRDEISRQKSTIQSLMAKIDRMEAEGLTKPDQTLTDAKTSETSVYVSPEVVANMPESSAVNMQATVAPQESTENTQSAFIIDEQFNKHKALFRNEDWVGISLFNRLGILLVLIGTVAVAAFEGFPALLRTSILFVCALVFIGLGEFMNRKKPTTFSIGLSATGVALSYIATAASYFALETLNMYTALIVCIIATTIGVFLATRYKAQVIGCFALIGGYLPIFALDPFNNPMLIGVMVYFILLSLFSLILALTHKWIVANIIGFVLTVAGVSYLGLQADPTISLMYACFAFLVYTALPLLSTYRTKGKFGTFDFSLIIVNTFISSIVIFAIANRLDIDNLHAYLCVIFAAIYAGTAYLVKRMFAHKNMQTIFTLTAIGFAFMFVPFFFEHQLFAIGWLVQATVLACFGVLRNQKLAEYSGLGILMAAVLAFIGNMSFYSDMQFKVNYLILTACAIIICSCYIVKGRHWQGYEQVYKVTAFANLWIFAMYIISEFLQDYVFGMLNNNVLEYFIAKSLVVVTFIFVHVYYKVKLFTDKVMQALAGSMHFIVIALVTSISIYFGISQNDGDNFRIALNLGTVAIGLAMVICYYIKDQQNFGLRVFKNINVAVLSFMLIWTSYVIMDMKEFFGTHMASIAITFIIAFTMTRLPVISDKSVKLMAIGLHSMGIIWLWAFNLMPYTYVLELVIMNGIVQIMALVALHDIITLWGAKEKLSALKIVVLSGYFLLVVTQGMLVQTDITFNSAVISIMYAIAAFAWIVIGFKFNIKPLRKAGLCLSMMAVAKLLIVDTWGLSTEMRIISYISLGLILMLISFIYQKLSKRIENEQNVSE